MKTDPQPHRSEAGSTLIEVLIAMIILAIGLLGLEALGIQAIRSLGLADRNSRATAVASEYLEQGLGEIRQDQLPGHFACTFKNGDRVVRTVDTDDPNLPRVTVDVIPGPVGVAERSVTVSSSAYSSNGLPGPAPDDTNDICPS